MKSIFTLASLSHLFPTPSIKEMNTLNHQDFALDLLEGLSSTPKFIPAKYHYDKKGSDLFQKITDLKEYYLTRLELENLEKYKESLGNVLLGKNFRLIELGVGDAHKTQILLRYFLENDYKFEYMPIDCCKEMLNKAISNLNKEFSRLNLKILGIAGDYFDALSWLSREKTKTNVVLFLGSSIGNFDPEEMRRFLYHLWGSLNTGDYVLIGFDLKKDISMLQKAYNDDLKITEAFNLNLLDRINDEFNANFDQTQFKYHSFYNPSESRIESWIISLCDQEVAILVLEKIFHFKAWEGIHVENSYKYDFTEIEHYAKETGFIIREKFVDPNQYFMESLWEVKKDVCVKGADCASPLYKRTAR